MLTTTSSRSMELEPVYGMASAWAVGGIAGGATPTGGTTPAPDDDWPGWTVAAGWLTRPASVTVAPATEKATAPSKNGVVGTGWPSTDMGGDCINGITASCDGGQ